MDKPRKNENPKRLSGDNLYKVLDFYGAQYKVLNSDYDAAVKKYEDYLPNNKTEFKRLVKEELFPKAVPYDPNIHSNELNRLARILDDRYTKAPKGNKSLIVNMFGIQYHKEISKYGVPEFMKQCMQCPTGMSSDLNKGVSLGPYTEIVKWP
jgi:hypothetical protein